MTEKRLKIIYSFTVSAIFTVIFIAIATVLSELYHPFKSWLAETFTHHWIGKGVLAVIVFLGMRFFYSFFYFHRIPVGVDTRLRKALLILFWITIISSLILLGFFILHFLELL
jgi:hypothetical protein